MLNGLGAPESVRPVSRPGLRDHISQLCARVRTHTYIHGYTRLSLFLSAANGKLLCHLESRGSGGGPPGSGQRKRKGELTSP